jgi:phosphate transport system substrate-binding protein
VQGGENNKSALGYFGFAYYAAHKDKLRAVAIDGGKGPVLPSVENVINGTYQPLSRPLFVYVKESSAKRPEVREFVQFMMTQGADLVTEVGYVPLPRAFALAFKHFNDKSSVRSSAYQVGHVDKLLAMKQALISTGDSLTGTAGGRRTACSPRSLTPGRIRVQ